MDKEKNLLNEEELDEVSGGKALPQIGSPVVKPDVSTSGLGYHPIAGTKPAIGTQGVMPGTAQGVKPGTTQAYVPGTGDANTESEKPTLI